MKAEYTPLTKGQRDFADKRVKFLEHQIRLLKLGKPGVNQVIKENQAELANIRMQLQLDDLNSQPAIAGVVSETSDGGVQCCSAWAERVS